MYWKIRIGSITISQTKSWKSSMGRIWSTFCRCILKQINSRVYNFKLLIISKYRTTKRELDDIAFHIYAWSDTWGLHFVLELENQKQICRRYCWHNKEKNSGLGVDKLKGSRVFLTLYDCTWSYRTKRIMSSNKTGCMVGWLTIDSPFLQEISPF